MSVMVAALSGHERASHPVKVVEDERDESFLRGLVSRGDLAEQQGDLLLRLCSKAFRSFPQATCRESTVRNSAGGAKVRNH